MECIQPKDPPGAVFREDWSRGLAVPLLSAAGSNRGFTLLEVTIVLVISGILAAIALPSFLDQANKAKQVEAKMYLGTINRAQQGYMLERARFADSVNELGVTVHNSPNYSYSIRLDSAGTQYAIHDAKALGARLRPYVGMVAVAQDQCRECQVRHYFV